VCHKLCVSLAASDLLHRSLCAPCSPLALNVLRLTCRAAPYAPPVPPLLCMSCRQRLPVEVALALVKAGAPLDAGDSNGNTALHYTLERENPKVSSVADTSTHVCVSVSACVV
jgi:hypothetical protein